MKRSKLFKDASLKIKYEVINIRLFLLMCDVDKKQIRNY